jgi:hypothetical protein
MNWTKGGVDSPLVKVIIAVVGAGIMATLLLTGVIKTHEAPKDACGGCGAGNVCIGESVVRGPDGRLKYGGPAQPTCRQACDLFKGNCPADNECRAVTGGGACFPK